MVGRRGYGLGGMWALVLAGVLWGLGLLGADGVRAGASDRPVKVRVVQGAAELSSLPMLVAREQGFFKKYGLEVEPFLVQGSARVITAVLSGDAEFGQAVVSAVISAYNQGAPVLAFANFFDRFTQVGVIHIQALPPGLDPRTFARLPVEQRLVALKGKRLGIAGVGGLVDTVTRWLMRKVRIDPEREVQLVNVQSTPALLGALRQRQIDAYILTPPSPYQAVKDGYGVIYLDGTAGEIPELATFHSTCLVTTRSVAESRPELVRRMAAAVAEATRWAVAHPEETVELMKREFPRIDPDVVAASTRTLLAALAVGGRFREEGIRRQMEFMVEGGQLRAPVTTREGTYWTNTYLPGA